MSNEYTSTDLLRDNGIVFTSKNSGAHLIVEGNDGFIDYWPGTGRWKTRGNPGTWHFEGKNSVQGFGAHNLVAHINKSRGE